jgi:maltose/moltooligosaccharide transporter
MKLNWKNTFIIGLGFFAVSIVWPIYNSYMPIFYAKFGLTKTVIGYLMTIDNWLALSLTPLVGYLSDRTRTRFGRRIPYLLVGAPLAALFMALIPFGLSTSLILLLSVSVLMNLAMASFRSPIVALMPDVTPSELRSKANGIINFMGGLGYIAATAGGAMLYRLYPGYPFFAVAVLLVGVTLAFLLWIREPAGATEKSERFSFGMVREPSALWMLAAIFFWFIGYNGVETWLTTYGKEHLGQNEADVAGLLFFSGAAFLLMAIPAGFVSEGAGRWKGLGRKWTILLGLAGMGLSYYLISTLTDLSQGKVFLLMVGLSWALVNINSYPMITQMAPLGQIGTYTGLYYLASSGANIAGPPIFGWVFDNPALGYGYFLQIAVGFMAAAALCMLPVRRGEARSSTASEAAD